MKRSLFPTKTLMVLLFILALVPLGYGQEYYHYYQGRKIYYDIATDRVIVKFKSQPGKAAKDSLYNKHSFLKRGQERQSGLGLTYLDMKEGLSKTAVTQLLQRLKDDPATQRVSPVLLDPATKEPVGGIGDQFIVKLKSGGQAAVLQKIARETRTHIVFQNPSDSLTYYLKVDNRSKGNAMEMANYFYETHLFAYAEPDLLLFVKPATSDPYYNQQYSIVNTGQTVAGVTGTAGADMKVTQAWQTTTGTGIKVAIVDNMVQTNHPDLNANMLLTNPGYQGYDEVTTSQAPVTPLSLIKNSTEPL